MDGGGAVVPHVLVAGSLDPVCVVPSAFDSAGTGAVPALGVEILVPGDVGHDAGQDGLGLLRGKSRADGPAGDAQGAPVIRGAIRTDR